MIVVGILGLLMLTSFISNDLGPVKSILYRAFGSGLYGIIRILGILFGAVIVIYMIATPYLAVQEAKKYFINVYGDCVAGCSIQKGREPRKFEIPLAQIKNVKVALVKVYIYTASDMFECRAFNAKEIYNAINNSR